MVRDDILVSVIVPMYNVEKYLSECIDSIINQTHTIIEIILVNDGSPDNSGRIADSYAKKDSRIKVIHQKNGGVSSARNAGINVATGEYICFADSDDRLMPDYVEYLLDIALKMGSDISLTTEMYTNYSMNQVSLQVLKEYTPEKATTEILYYHIPIGVYCKLFKRSFLGDSIRFKTELFIGEGFNFNVDAFQRANKIGVGNKKIYFYRRDNNESATTKFSIKKWVNGLYAIDYIYKDIIIRTPSTQLACAYANWHTHCDVLNQMVIANVEQEYPEMYSKCLKVARKDAIYAFRSPIGYRAFLRAIIMLIYPRLLGRLMMQRRKKLNIK